MSESPTMHMPEHILESIDTVTGVREKADTICLYNFEASNVAADAVSAFVFAYRPVQIHTIVDRKVSAWVNERVDVIIMSYSGDSVEIDEVYAEAKARGCRIHCITSGGKLRQLCENHGDDLILIPGGLSNCDATGYEIGVLAGLYESMGIDGVKDAIRGAMPKVVAYRDRVWDSDEVKRLAVQIRGKIPAIYCTGELRAVHKRWKMLINEVVGELAFSGEFPEFDHNELVSWTFDGSDTSKFIVIVFKTETDSDLLNDIMSTAVSLLKEHGLKVRDISLEGTLMERVISGIVFADAVASYLKEAE